MVCSLEKKIGEAEKKFEETNKLSEQRLRQAMEAESKIVQLKTAMQRLSNFFASWLTLCCNWVLYAGF